MDQNIALRPHHLLCIQNYIGKGYSDAFTAHMEEVIGMLGKDPQIQLVTGCDELCSACPHNAGGVCDSADDVDRLDQGVLDTCGLTPGQREHWSVLSAAAKELVLQTEQFEKICSACQWYEICHMQALAILADLD